MTEGATEAAPEDTNGGATEDQQRPTGPALAVFGHPDDAEICAGGTLARWVAEGRDVHLLVLTNGDRGASDPSWDRAELAATRRAETEAAASFLGLASTRILDIHDGELTNTTAVRVEIVREIRRIRPATVVTCDPTAWFFGNYFNHADHRTAGEAALDAVFPAAGNPLFFEELLRDEGLEPWNVPEVWVGWTPEPNLHHDVTGYIEKKVAALALHASQVADEQLGFFEQWLPSEAEEAGRKVGVQHAESFRVLQLG